MKILCISLKNLHSLLGEHTIDFRQGSLATTSLFAITGETGAGKTTILDAITLALYAKTSRHENLNYNIKQDEIWENVVSKGKEQAYAELIFEVEGEAYAARWEVRRKPRGFEYNRFFSSLKRTNFIFTMIKEVEIKIQTIIQLTYDQFLRSIMLAQGNFMSFLKAEEKERKELLSKITNTHIYEKIIQKAKEKLKEERQKKERLEEGLQGIDLLSETEFENLKLKKAFLTQEVLSLDKAWVNHSNILEKTKKLNEYLMKLATNEQEKAHIQAQILHHQEDFKRLASYRKAVPIAPSWKVFQKLDNEIANIENQKIVAEEKLKEVILNLSTYENLLKEAQKNLDATTQNAENFEKWVQTEIAPLEKEIESLEKDCKTEFANMQNEQKKVQDSVNNVIAVKQDIEKLKENKNNFTLYLTKNSYIKNFNKEIFKTLLENRKTFLFEYSAKLKYADELKNDILNKHKEALLLLQPTMQSEDFEENYDSILKQLQNSKITFEKIEKEKKQLNAKEKEQKEKQNRLHQTEKQLQSIKEIIEIITEKNKKIAENTQIQQDLVCLTQDLKKAQAEFDRAADSVYQQERIYLLEQKVLDLEEDRKKLREDEPCPLCGSCIHPYREEGHDIQLSKTEQKLELLKVEKIKSEKLLKQIQLDKNKKETENEILRKAIEKSEINRGDKVRLFLAQNSFYAVSVQTLDWENEAAIKDFTSFLEKNIEEEKTEIKKAEGEIMATKLEIETLEKKQNLYQILSAYAKEKNDLQAKVAEGRKNFKLLQENFLNFNQIVDKNSDFELILKNLEQEKQQFEQIQKQLEGVSQAAAAAEATLKAIEKNNQDLNQNLEQIQKKYNALQTEKENKEVEKRALLGEKRVENEREFFKKEKEKIQENLASAKEKVEKYRNLRIENETTIATLYPQIEEKSAEKLNIGKELRQKFLHLGFTSLDLFQQTLAWEKEAEQWEILEKELQEKVQKLDIERNNFENEIKRTKEDIADKLPQQGESIADYIQKLEQENKENKCILDQKREEKGIYEQKIKDQMQKIEKFEQKLREKDKQESIMRHWETLCEVLAPKSRDGIDLNVFAQGITLGYLIDLANERLLQLNPRYILKRKDTKSLNFVVVDLHQDQQERLVSSLSGGESFLVSLALALALSELTSHRRSLQSLFIDEGFGTLDPQTLEMALDALEKLQGEGKMIGIISHVELIKSQDRIPVQILVQKMGGGRSKIVLPA
ncbi:AAA family ATPase [Hugenholtzia roseola]|uniref:AAA family ATPase n=1 Tax=Hugenholtzia roseola TaxID=1002 RepID=UPI0004033A93|nr:AAA family ATPase [Hugenholtzia roseola]